MKTNGHVWFCYEHDEYVPTGKLSLQQIKGASELRHGIEVVDESGFILAVFRNPTDAGRYRDDMAKRHQSGRAQYEAACKADTSPDEGKVACPTCGKHVAWNGLKQHKRDSHGRAP